MSWAHCFHHCFSKEISEQRFSQKWNQNASGPSSEILPFLPLSDSPPLILRLKVTPLIKPPAAWQAGAFRNIADVEWPGVPEAGHGPAGGAGVGSGTAEPSGCRWAGEGPEGPRGRKSLKILLCWSGQHRIFKCKTSNLLKAAWKKRDDHHMLCCSISKSVILHKHRSDDSDDKRFFGFWKTYAAKVSTSSWMSTKMRSPQAAKSASCGSSEQTPHALGDQDDVSETNSVK